MEELKISPVDKFFDNPYQFLFPSKVELKKLFYLALCIAIGIIAWDCYLPMAIFFPVLWVNAPGKITPWLMGLSYHLAASRGLISGIPVFFDASVMFGVFLWLAAGLIQSLPYLICTHMRNRYLGILIILFLLIIPPVGIVGWANPLTAAGVLFPGTGFVGLFLSLGLILTTAWLQSKKSAWFYLLAAIILLWPLAVIPVQVQTNSIKGISTHFSGNPGNLVDKFNQDYEKFMRIFQEHADTDFKILLLPESSGGIWFKTTQYLWGQWQRKLESDQSIILPVLFPEGKTGFRTYNSLVEIKRNACREIYRARQSVPVAMWKPWAKDDVKTNWFDNPVFDLAGKKATAIICYEAYLTWPVLQSFLAGEPETILFVSNHWWSKNTSLLGIQKTCVNSWGALFGVQVVTAVNF